MSATTGAAMRRAIVCGGRDLGPSESARVKLRTALERHRIDVVVHGGCRGADRIAGEVARDMGLDVDVHRAEWKRLGREAGPVRNEQMAESGADVCLAMPGGRGTESMVRIAQQWRIPVERIALPSDGPVEQSGPRQLPLGL